MPRLLRPSRGISRNLGDGMLLRPSTGTIYSDAPSMTASRRREETSKVIARSILQRMTSFVVRRCLFPRATPTVRRTNAAISWQFSICRAEAAVRAKGLLNLLLLRICILDLAGSVRCLTQPSRVGDSALANRIS